MKTTKQDSFVTYETTVTKISSWFQILGLVGLAAMATTALIDVVGSKLLGLPLPGSTEITVVLQIMAIGAGLAVSQLTGQQIRVDIVTDLLPKRIRALLYLFSTVMGILFFVIAGWTLFGLGASLASASTKTLLLGIPLAPFAFWVALCCIPMCLAIAVELLNSIRGLIR